MIKKICALSLLLAFALPVLAAPAKKLPDLKLTKVKATKKVVKGKTKLVVSYTVKNVGLAAAPASTTGIAVRQLSTKTNEQTCPPLKPNEEYSTEWSCDVKDAGKYQIKVGADYRNYIPEMDEINNQNTITFGVSRPL